jgi:hypothetical protein
LAGGRIGRPIVRRHPHARVAGGAVIGIGVPPDGFEQQGMAVQRDAGERRIGEDNDELLDHWQAPLALSLRQCAARAQYDPWACSELF